MTSTPIYPSIPIIHAVTDKTPVLLDTLVEMFLTVFPEDRRYVPLIHHWAQCVRARDPLGVFHLWLLEYQGELVGFRIFQYLRQRHFGYGQFVGLLPRYRGSGLGWILQRYTMEQICTDAAANGQKTPIGFCGEIADPLLASDEGEGLVREQRKEIFRRFGAHFPHVNYAAPYMVAGHEEESRTPESVLTSRLFYIIPIRRTHSFEKSQVAHFVRGVLLDGYRLNRQSPLVNETLASIGRSNHVLVPHE
ncbi:MAG: hypothetical protein GFH27_549301n286 [Chloroflexi bacterium AL-W]|nr:hypothetical protein [Chloroflexi bacterium AL-N1]NOK68480.1 hypothetical protein [Chloroflexi bacterium AL-N10]NOK74126.1 hypothetical protein [Chloroflexi bacterium AL-N5]NOK83093.1 hypothetical protein [Chloroflexi bacterium AL-W]NOK90616.1 hypothetical protein [Chloroflexi bacterium AL-N15]